MICHITLHPANDYSMLPFAVCALAFSSQFHYKQQSIECLTEIQIYFCFTCFKGQIKTMTSVGGKAGLVSILLERPSLVPQQDERDALWNGLGWSPP